MTARGKALLWAGVVLVCLVMLFVKVRLESGSALEAARAAKVKGDKELTGLLYRRAIRWYSPLSSSVEAGVKELWELAAAAEKASANGEALGLFRDLRGALYAIRHVIEPYLELREQAEERIAALMSKEPPTTVEDRSKSEEDRRSFFLAQLRSVHAPDVAWTLALLLGFFGWVASAAVFFWRGFTREGKLRAWPAARWAACLVACFALWVVGMTQA